MDDEKLIKEVIEETINGTIDHPIEKIDIPIDAYCDYHNDLGFQKPKYLDPQKQRSQ